MSAMSDRAIQIDEAKELCGYDLVACERDHYKEQRDQLIAALEEIALGNGPYSRDPLQHAANCIDNMTALAREAIAKVKTPERDAET